MREALSAAVESPFHPGEQQVQERLGVRDKIEAFARRVVRDHLPDQHREFYGELPFVLLGTVDGDGRPWASLMAGGPGFISSPDPGRLHIAAAPLFGDPIQGALTPGADVGLLGIQLESRRRNRLTGRVAALQSGGFAIEVRQTFGNCPQYIQSRGVKLLPRPSASATKPPVHRTDRFDAPTRSLIEQADTLFIATAYLAGQDTASRGADVSHRGGKPGFVRVEDERTFVFPDFSGNNHFNTVGNILLNPKAGFLFVDFEKGDLVYMTGGAEIQWEGEEVRAFAGAERLIRFQAAEVIRVEGSLPLRFAFGGYSPMLDHTGSWAQTAETIAAEKERNLYMPYEVTDVVKESEAISSFYLRRADGKALAGYEPGQFLPIRLTIPGEEGPVTRTYTLSDAPNGDHYRLSIKREGGDALVSNFLHDQAGPGFRLEAMAPRGKFVLDWSSERPVVLISAGVGITPMIAMTNFIAKEGQRTRNFRRTYFLHGARNGAGQAFGAHLRQLAVDHDFMTAHICYSRPGELDRLGPTYHGEGRIDLALLKRVLPFDDYEFYLCGPQGFMQDLYAGLRGLGVRDERLHTEAFGPATVLKGPVEPAPRDTPAGDPVAVTFAKSDRSVTWQPGQGSLLDLAEREGLSPAYSCRSGLCGTCAVPLRAGAVDYDEQPLVPPAEDEALICCATPRAGDGPVVLDL